MSFGKMNTCIEIAQLQAVKDSDGFAKQAEVIVASVSAYREGQHGTEKWANRAAFSEATDLFRFRRIPGVTVTTAMVIVCADGRFEITSVEDVRGRGMYLKVLARKVNPSG